MGHKVKKQKTEEDNDVELKEEDENAAEDDNDYELKLKFINPIASPMASKKLVKRLYKCIKKGRRCPPCLDWSRKPDSSYLSDIDSN